MESSDEASDNERMDDEIPSASTGGGYDDLAAPLGTDIPRVDDIPVVSKLAKVTEKERLAEMDGAAQLEYL